jgi:hypothetical protein
MIWWSKRITKKYALDLCFLYKIRQFKDGIDFLLPVCKLDFFRGDHNPQFEFSLIILNFMVFSLNIYNINHVKEE